MLLYIGPDQIIPLSGVFGTLAGLALIFWGKVTHGFRKLACAFSPKSRSEEKAQS